MICAIIATSLTGCIGNKGTLPWPKHTEDLAWFKDNTMNNVVVMGRATWDDPKMPKPLPNRINIVVSHRSITIDKVRTINGDLLQQLPKLQSQFPTKDIFVIGGKEVLLSSMSLIERIYLTRIKLNPYCDTRIEIDKLLNRFRLKSVKPGKDCTYEIWDKII